MFASRLHAVKLLEASDWGRARWTLCEPLIFVSAILGRIEVPIGFESDYASVPRLPGTYWLTGDTAHQSAVVHDYLCTDGRTSWVTAAKVFQEAMKCEGVPAWRAWLMYWAVRLAKPRFRKGVKP